ncbi:MAG TPA: endo alpha-1,4 polygalactosaminidase [Polyangiales bacterium]|nr:endo alpha-1,4 polygalactosaminidase [Polyangiales bacterium]
MLVLGLCCGACDATDGPLLVRVDAATPPPEGAVRPGMSLQYQITGELDLDVDADLYVTDLFDTDAPQIGELHAAERLVMAYVSVGSLENWRPDAASVPRAAVGQALASYPNESWLDIRRSEVRALMRARLDRAVSKGFDGVFASTLGVYRATSGFTLTRADELDYAEFLAAEAHARNLSIGLSGAFELATELAEHYDWAIATSCIERGTCAELAPLSAAGLPVFDLETSAETERAAVCNQARSLGITVTFKRRGFDAYQAGCP